MNRREFLAAGAAAGGLAAFGAPAFGQTAEATPDWLKGLYETALSNNERTVVYYPTGAGQEPLLEAFSKEFPEVKVEYKYTIASELSAILDAEVASGQRNIDMTQGGPILQLRLRDSGRQAQWKFPDGSGIPETAAFYDNRMFTNGRTITGVAYNTKRLQASDVPTTLDAFLTPEWKGRVAIQKPTGAVAIDNTMAILRENGMLTEEQIARIAELPTEAGNVALQTALGQGRYDVALWATSAAFSSIVKQGAPIAMLAPPTVTTAQNDVVCLLDGAPHPNAGRLLMGWLLSRPGQTYIPMSGVYSLYPDLSPPPNLPDITGVDLKVANFDTFADQAVETRKVTVKYWP